MSMYNLGGGSVQLQRSNCSIPAVKVFNLKRSGCFSIAEYAKVRQYAEVAELPPGLQAQVDMGQKVMKDMWNKSVRIYIFAMVMSVAADEI